MDRKIHVSPREYHRRVHKIKMEKMAWKDPSGTYYWMCPVCESELGTTKIENWGGECMVCNESLQSKK